jgi:NitT/TauT family transport system substrate-binding protein
VSVDPVISLLDSEKAIRIVADTRTLAGTHAVYGGPYPAAVLYMPPSYIQNNAKTVQSLVNAFVRGLKFIEGQPAAEIAKVLPAEYALGNPALFVRSIQSSVPTYSTNGLIGQDGPQTALKVLREFDDSVKKARIDLAATYTEDFVKKAPAR